MKKKYSVDVQSIKYKDEEIPIIVKTNGKAYIINENLMVENNHVFNGGGVGTKYTIKINKKETCIYQDKTLSSGTSTKSMKIPRAFRCWMKL